MIKTTNLHKYFNKGKSNEIHVINNTSLEFPKQGLVSLVGQSGSGKTTLLNVISGLDSAKGKIEFGDTVLDKYQSSTWDKLRAHDIGYIFQNYYLLEDRSVYDNIKLTLNMIGIVDEKEVEYRVHYVLDAVGMYRFRRKKASDLSGGQKQRVAIARAIAKNPKVIIADEPTGNLDSKNSIDVMKIIKKISEERLVVLVTHETNLAYKYSDRIVTLTDGVVSMDQANMKSDETELTFDDKNIYLGNLNKHSDSNNLELYSNSPTNDIKLRVIKINNNYYLESSDSNVRFNIVTPKSGIEIINDTKENIEKNQAFDTEFSLDELEKMQTKRVKKRTLSLKYSVIEAFRKITNLGRKSKVQVFALILLGVMFSIAIHTLFSNLIFDESKIYHDKNIYSSERFASTTLLDSLLDHENLVVYFTNDRFYDTGARFKVNDRFQNMPIENLAPLAAIKETDIIKGRLPNNKFEVVIDESTFDKSYSKNFNYKIIGINNVQDLLGQKIVHYAIREIELTIVGVVNNGYKSLYIDDSLLFSYNTSTRIVDTMIVDGNEVETGLSKTVLLDNVNGVAPSLGRLPNASVDDGKYEVMISDEFMVDYPLDFEFKLRGDYWEYGTMKVVGHFNQQAFDQEITLKFHNNDLNHFIRIYFERVGGVVQVYSLNGQNPNVSGMVNLRQDTIDTMKEQQKATVATSITQITIALVVSGIIFYFLVRSSLTAKVREISILRSLGVSKGEVVSLYSLEYFILTAATSLIGVFVGTIISRSIGNSFLGGLLRLRVTPLSFLIAIIFIFVTNILIALIPVLMLLRKTPAQMLTSYDI